MNDTKTKPEKPATPDYVNERHRQLEYLSRVRPLPAKLRSELEQYRAQVARCEDQGDAPACAFCGPTSESIANDAAALGISEPICCEVAL